MGDCQATGLWQGVGPDHGEPVDFTVEFTCMQILPKWSGSGQQNPFLLVQFLRADSNIETLS